MNKKQMIEYLTNHFRYDTAGSWNQSTSYGANVKIRNFVPQNFMDKAYDILDQGDVFENINDLIMEFGEAHNHTFQVGFNGRSNGYLVLYQGGRKDTGVFTYPCRGMDMDKDFSEWETYSLKERVKLVKDFDKLVEDCKKEFIYICQNYVVKEETIQVPKTIKVLEEISK